MKDTIPIWPSLPPFSADGSWFGGDLYIGAAGTIGSHYSSLSESEKRYIGAAVPKRIDEFSTGRFLARRVLARLGADWRQLSDHPGPRPMWPERVVGSITHCDDAAIVVASSNPRVRAIGVDIEKAQPVDKALFELLFTSGEIEALAEAEVEAPNLPVVLFSAKEAVYKAVNPLTDAYIEHRDVELEIDRRSGSFSARYSRPDHANSVLETGEGSFIVTDTHVFAQFLLRR